MLPDLHIGFSRGKSGGLVFPSLSESSSVYSDPHSPRLGIVNKAEIGVLFFFFFPGILFFQWSKIVGIWISGSSAFSKTSLNIWKFKVHVLMKPGLENFEHYCTRIWDECNCVVIWAILDTVFIWGWNENWHFSVPCPLLFSSLLAYWVQHFHSIIFQDLKLLNENFITSTSIVCSDSFYGPLDFTFQDVWL